MQTFDGGLSLGGNTYLNLAGTGLSFSGGTLSSALGTSIESSEITDGTIANADLADATITFGKISSNSCSVNQIIKWNGSAWVCSADNNDTYTAGTGLSLLSGAFALDINGLTAVSSVNATDTIAVYTGSGLKKITRSDMFSDVLGAMNYRGTWNATLNSPNLSAYCSAGNKGHYYVVGTAGTTDLSGIASWAVNDWAVCNGTAWEKVQTTNAVISVFGRTGAIIASGGDYSASQITNTPSGNIAAITVQNALNELDSEKLATGLNSGLLWIGNASNQAAAVSMSGDVTISNTGTTTIATNAVALGTDTTGNYVATIADSGSSIISVANSGTENAAVTLGIVDDSLNFTKLADGLTLDAGTSITLGGNDLTTAITGAGLPKFTRTLAGQWMSFADGTDTFGIYNRAGTPEANIVADKGSLAVDTTNGALYIKTTDTVNTGWSTVGGGLSSNADFNTKGGTDAGLNLVSGAQYNTFLGYQAGLSSSTASTAAADENTAIGYQSLFSNTTGGWNTANGVQSLYSNTIGNLNTANGSWSLYSNTTGGWNTANGDESLFSNTTGNDNTADGSYSLYSNTTGGANTANGYYSLFSNTTGGTNTADGYYSLYSNTTGSRNIALGYRAGGNLTTGSNNLIIGYNIDAPSATGNNQMSIGNLIFGTGIDGTGTTISSGKVGIGTASPNTTVDVNGDFSMRKGTDFSTTGTTNNANLGSYSLVRLTGSSAQTITGIAGGYDGKILVIMNAGSASATLSHNSANSTVSNRIYSSTASDLAISANSSLMLQYDAGINMWRPIGTPGAVASLPTVTTASTSWTATATALSGGNITSDGGSSITASGVVWGTSIYPTISSYVGITNDTVSSGSFSSIISGLTSDVTYYVRAYATNANGTVYGNQLTYVNTVTTQTISYTGVIQQIQIPAGTTKIRLDAAGARGGGATASYGTGARMQATFTVTPLDYLKILVGGQGTVASGFYSGGGGTFVTDASNSAFIVAGGGGGANTTYPLTGSNANTITSGNNASTTAGGGLGGTGGGAGQANICDYNGGPGGGLTGEWNNYYLSGGWGGRSFTNGGAGGSKGTYGASAGPNGGFGGGGGASHGAGGGGGYSGGGGSGNCGGTAGSGGGGGSFIKSGGTDSVSTTGYNSTGNGSLTITYYPGGADLAENYPTKDATLSAGEIVSLDTVNAGFVKRAEKGERVIGMVSTNPHTIMGKGDYPNEREVPIALAGRVSTKVTTEAGPIKIGDLITLSSQAGVGMKAEGYEATVGYALENYDGSGVGTISVYVQNEKETKLSTLADAIKNGVVVTAESLDSLVLSGGLVVNGIVDLGKDSVGEAVIKTGATEVAVVFEKPYTYQPIVTITKLTQGALTDYYVDEVNKNGFKIKIDPTQSKNITFSWHAFGSKNGIRIFSDGVKENIIVVEPAPIVAEPQPSDEPMAGEAEIVASNEPVPPTETPADVTPPEIAPSPEANQPLAEEATPEQPASEPVVEPIVETITEPVVEPTPEPVIEPTPELTPVVESPAPIEPAPQTVE